MNDERASLARAALDVVNSHLSGCVDALEDVPPEAFANPEDRYRLGELIARAGGVVAAAELELARGGGGCDWPLHFPRLLERRRGVGTISRSLGLGPSPFFSIFRQRSFSLLCPTPIPYLTGNATVSNFDLLCGRLHSLNEAKPGRSR